MSHVFHRHTRMNPPTAASGEGCYIIDTEGKRYLDACGGAAVSCLGHSDPDVIQAIKDQADRIPFAHTAFFTNDAMETLADRLVSAAPADSNRTLDRVYFVSGGTEAVEAAMKLARQYFVETGEPQRRHFIARRQSYHGNTLAALAVGGNEWRREPFRPLLIESHHISPCYEYRGRQDEESTEEYGQRVADELDAKLRELGPETVIAFIAEPVVGATAGAVPAVEGYFKRIREICDRYGVLLILDEVMCGMGRTGSLFAYEQDGIVPDLVCIAKGLGAGYQPIGAMLCTQKIYGAIASGSGFFQHGHTYIGHPTACAAALAVQSKLQAPDMMARVREKGAALDERLRARFGNHHHVGDVRGRGLFRAIELVEDRDSKAPFAPKTALNKKVKAEAMARGLMCYPMGGTIDGRQGDHVLLAPPFIVSDEQIDEIVDVLGEAVDAAIASARH